MAKPFEVLAFLRPNGGYVQVGQEYEGITFEPQCEPFTKAEYEAAFADYDAWKAEQDAAAKAQKQAILDRLGLTEDELRIVLGQRIIL